MVLFLTQRLSMAHRKVDVDEIVGDEDAFIESEILDPSVSVEVLNQVASSRLEKAKELLSRGAII